VVVLGIDTDAKGSMAILDTHALTLDVYAVPHEYNITNKGKGTKRISTIFSVLAAILGDLTSYADVAFLEKQWGWEGQAAGATFGFGTTYGDIRSSTASGFIQSGLTPEQAKNQIIFIKAEEWKNALHIGGDKKRAVALASQIFPKCSSAWEPRGKPVSAAEASLIALYGATISGVRLTPGTVFEPRLCSYTSHADSLIAVQ
jgi:hypothetical protein